MHGPGVLALSGLAYFVGGVYGMLFNLKGVVEELEPINDMELEDVRLDILKNCKHIT